MKKAVFTIASKNYFSYVRTLMQSLKENEPDWTRFVILVDDYLNEEQEKPLIEDESLYEIIKAKDLGLPNPLKMFFKYSILELNTAVKPWGFGWLFKEKNFDTVVYLDPDICVYSKMAEVDKELEDEDRIVLTPHITSSVPDDNVPNEQALMRFGVYNLGFIGLSKGEDTLRLVEWWQGKLENNCVEDLENGIYVDQKWMDIVPALFRKVTILRNAGYNVAYWNQVTRKFSFEDGQYKLNGDPLVFFHFSHVSLLNTKDKLIDSLVNDYKRRIDDNQVAVYKKLPYAYAKFSDGSHIPIAMRIAYRLDKELQQMCGDNPFDGGDTLMTLPAPRDSKHAIPMTILMESIWKTRPDLQHAFPDYKNEHREAFANWFIYSAEREYGISKHIIKKIEDAIEAGIKAHAKEVKHNIKARPSFKSRLKFKIYRIIISVGKIFQPVLKRILPKRLKNYLAVRLHLVPQASAVEPAVSQTPDYSAASQKGINLFSYIKGEFSIGEVGRIIARGINTTDTPFSIYDISEGNLHRFGDNSWNHKVTDNPSYNVNIFAFNADSVTYFRNKLGASYWKDKYNIGYWNWELSEFPDQWKEAFNYFNEIWTGSRFVADALAIKSPVPIQRIPLTVEMKPDEKMDRDYFNIPKDRFLFLCMYDVLSVQSRKNPQGAVNAFIKAFGNNDDVGLVIKVNNSRASENDIAILHEMIKHHKNIYLIDKTLSRTEIDSLINVTDVFVSLHRAEGFGLVLTESMYLRKPVIATNWSANTDYMNLQNSCPVDYKLIKVGSNAGPYSADQLWADPDEEHAAEYMKKLFFDREYYNKIAVSGEKTIKSEYSPEAMGRIIQKRLREINVL